MTIRRPDPDQPHPAPDPTEGEESPIVLPIDDALDLHTFAPRDLPDVVRDYLEECVTHGFREVRLIHGRGTGTQRRIVRSVLTGNPLVESFADAPPERGGWGATVVRLREGPHTAHKDR